MKRLELYLIFLLIFTASPTPLVATARSEPLSDFNPLEMYETVKGGTWRSLAPKEIKPDGINYSAVKAGVVSSVNIASFDGDDTARYESTQRAIKADFIYQLALLPTLIHYCLEHSLDDEFLSPALSPQAIDDFYSDKKNEIPARSYHFIHHTIGTNARFDFFKSLMPLDFLPTSSWECLSRMVTHIEKNKGPRVSQFPPDWAYFMGDQFITDLRQGVYEIIATYKMGDLLIGVGNTPQIPLRAISNILPFTQPTLIPLSGWPGRPKLGNSWLDNVLTPQALLHIDTHLKSILGPHESRLPSRVFFVDMVINGFGVSLLRDRIDQICHGNGWKTPPYHVFSLIDFTNLHVQNVIFEGKITLAKSSRLAVALDDDAIGRYVPSAPMRVWDAGIPSVEKPEETLDPILEAVDASFKKMTL